MKNSAIKDKKVVITKEYMEEARAIKEAQAIAEQKTN